MPSRLASAEDIQAIARQGPLPWIGWDWRTKSYAWGTQVISPLGWCPQPVQTGFCDIFDAWEAQSRASHRHHTALPPKNIEGWPG